MYDHSMNFLISSQFPFHSSFLASYSIPHIKKALLSCSVLLLITAAVAYFATSLTCSLGISNDSNYSSLCGQSLSAFSYYPQATSSAVSYSSIKIRNWVLFLSPVPSPCSLQQAVNTSDSQTAKIKPKIPILPTVQAGTPKLLLILPSVYVRHFSPQS